MQLQLATWLRPELGHHLGDDVAAQNGGRWMVPHMDQTFVAVTAGWLERAGAKRVAAVEEWDLDALRHAVDRGGPATLTASRSRWTPAAGSTPGPRC